MGKVCLAWAENVLFADLGQLRCEIMDSYQRARTICTVS